MRGSEVSRFDRAEQTDHNRRHDQGKGDSPTGNSGRHERRHLVVPLQPANRQDGCQQADDPAADVEKPGQAGGIIRTEALPVAARFTAVFEELREIPHQVRDDVNTHEARKRDHEDPDILTQEVALNNVHGESIPSVAAIEQTAGIRNKLGWPVPAPAYPWQCPLGFALQNSIAGSSFCAAHLRLERRTPRERREHLLPSPR